jgi:O-antigen/teichoic acid export membrane protein
VGLWLIHTIFGGSPAPSVAILTLLAAGTVLAMFVQILQPALLAVAAHRIVAVAWVAGVLAFAATFSMPIDAITRATLAALAASAITAAVMAVALGRRLGAPVTDRAPVDPTPRPVAD